jgi:hypothetical protein
MLIFSATEIFNLQKSGPFPLDCQFNENLGLSSCLANPGMYLMFFEEQLIYIGFADKESSISRFRKQLSTHTLRGSNVSFNTVCAKKIRSSSVLNNDFDQKILSLNKTGYNSSIKRIEFAEKNWKMFVRIDMSVLAKFSFLWFPNHSCFSSDFNKTKKMLIPKLKPLCNG